MTNTPTPPDEMAARNILDLYDRTGLDCANTSEAIREAYEPVLLLVLHALVIGGLSRKRAAMSAIRKALRIEP